MVGALVALTLAAGVAACGSSDTGSGDRGTSGQAAGGLGEKPGAGKKGGTLTVLAAGDVDYVDPGQVYYAFGYMVHYAVNRTLYSYGPGDNEKPRADLAVGEPQVSADKKTVTIKLRPGVHYAPPVNREVRAGDVKYAFERAFSAHVPSSYAGIYFKDIEGAPVTPGAIKDIPGIQTPDDHTIVFKLTKPSAALLVQAIAMPISTPVPPEYARKFDAKTPSTYDQYVAFSGPVHVQEQRLGQARRPPAGPRDPARAQPQLGREDRLPPGLRGRDRHPGGQQRRGLVVAADPQRQPRHPGRRHRARADHQAGASRTAHRSGSGSRRMSFARMNALISAAVFLASATIVSTSPWSLPSWFMTRRMQVRRPSGSSGGTGFPREEPGPELLGDGRTSRSRTRSASAVARTSTSSAPRPGPASSSISSFLANFSLPSRQSPVARGSSSFSRNVLVLLEGRDGRLARPGQRAHGRGLVGQVEDARLVERDRPRGSA